jgi:hypothetical protein
LELFVLVLLQRSTNSATNGLNFKDIAVAGRDDWVQDENAVCHGLTKVSVSRAFFGKKRKL